MADAPYRSLADVAKEIPPMPKTPWTITAGRWIVTVGTWLTRAVVASLILQAPLTIGFLHDICTPQHQGVCWGGGFVSLIVAVVTAGCVIAWAK